MTPQSTFMICADVLEGEMQSLRKFLTSMNREEGLADPVNSVIPFAQFQTLHMSRLLIIDLQVGDDIQVHGQSPRPWTPMLVFLGDCDGDANTFLAELSVRAAPGLKKLFSYCSEFDADQDNLLAWMKARNKHPAANYVNYLGRTVQQVREEYELHKVLYEQLQLVKGNREDTSPRLVHQSLREWVLNEVAGGRLKLTRPARTPLGWKVRNLIHLLFLPLLLLLLSPIILILLPLYLIRLRILEREDPEILPRPDQKRINRLSRLEDHLVTNQFSAFGDVKPGWFRRYTLIFLLYVLDYSARHVYNKGYLTRVRTIHFARWVLLDDKNRLLFASNYDGSLESYMDDFINKVAWGLNLVFSNGVGYPRTRFLVKLGAEQEQKFKYYLRNHQLFTDVWYKAYPELTTFDLLRNSLIRKGLEQTSFSNDSEIRQWLSLI